MKMVYKLIFGAALAATLVLAGCEESAATSTLNLPAIAAPNVTATVIPNGVKLEWDAIIDASSYTVYRREGGGANVSLMSGGSILTDNATGKKSFRDTQSASANSVRPGVAYTYTVVASASPTLKHDGKKEVSVTTGATFTPAGTRLAKPSVTVARIDGELANYDALQVTIVPDATHKDLVASYSVELYKGSSLQQSYTIAYPNTIGVYSLNGKTAGTDYKVKVTATGGSTYRDSDEAESAVFTVR